MVSMVVYGEWYPRNLQAGGVSLGRPIAPRVTALRASISAPTHAAWIVSLKAATARYPSFSLWTVVGHEKGTSVPGMFRRPENG